MTTATSHFLWMMFGGTWSYNRNYWIICHFLPYESNWVDLYPYLSSMESQLWSRIWNREKWSYRKLRLRMTCISVCSRSQLYNHSLASFWRWVEGINRSIIWISKDRSSPGNLRSGAGETRYLRRPRVCQIIQSGDIIHVKRNPIHLKSLVWYMDKVSGSQSGPTYPINGGYISMSCVPLFQEYHRV